MVAESRAATPRDPFEDHVGDREEPHAGEMSRGIRSSMVKNLEDKEKEKEGMDFVHRSVKLSESIR
jgi:hypothetical protein